MNSTSLEKLIEELASKHGMLLERRGNSIILRTNQNVPVFLIVKQHGNKILTLTMGYESLKDFVREVVDTEDNPKEVIEDIIDELTSIALIFSKEFEKRSYKVKMKIREKIMDIIDELEEALEE